MLPLPPGATPQQFIAGFFLLTFGCSVVLTAASFAVKSIIRRVRKSRAERAKIRRLAEIYGIEL